MYISDKDIFNMIVEMLEIEDEPDNQKELRKWIQDVGIDVVFKKVIQINTNCYV